MQVCRSGSSLLPAAALLLAGCASQPPPAATPPAPAVAAAPAAAGGGVLYHWAQVVSRAAIGDSGAGRNQPVLVARAVVGGAGRRCPTIGATLGGTPATARMVPRETGADRGDFPVLVCEARLPWSADEVQIDGRPLGFSPRGLGALAAHPVLVGDTGCKDKSPGDCPPGGSAPGDPDGWGFPGVAGAIAAGDPPSVLVHVGDYLYRRLPQDPRCGGGAPCDVWKAWEADFFAPAEGAGLLAAAPWLLARGNHETCTGEPRVEGGDGWFLFFSPVSSCVDPGDALPGCSRPVGLRTCRSADREFPPPWTVDLALPPGSSAPAVRVVMMDTSAGKEDDPAAAAAYRRQYEGLAATLDGAPRAWIVTHIPVYAVRKIEGGSGQKLKSVNKNLQTATRELSLPPALELALAGHRHIVQVANTDAVTGAAAAVPPHLVMGASGVALSGANLPAGGYRGTTKAGLDKEGTATLSGWIQRYHAFADLKPGDHGAAWKVTIVDAAGRSRADCDLRGGAPGWGSALTCRARPPSVPDPPQ